MRCVDLTATWSELRDWLDGAGVLILPRLDGTGPTVRLDADVDPGRPATDAEVALVLGRLRAVVERFAVPAVYVAGTVAEPLSGPAEPAAQSIRVLAGGVLHELTLVASWYGHLPQDAGMCLA